MYVKSRDGRLPEPLSQWVVLLVWITSLEPKSIAIGDFFYDGPLDRLKPRPFPFNILFGLYGTTLWVGMGSDTFLTGGVLVKSGTTVFPGPGNHISFPIF